MSSFEIDMADKKPIGKTGEKVSAIGIGTWQIRDYTRALEAYVHAVELGINMIDTAEMYGAGRAEEFVGKVVKIVGRDNLFITTKLMPQNLVDKGIALRAASSSIKRLGVKYADLILVHWPEKFIPVRVQIKSLEEIAQKGLTRYIGVSNFYLPELKEALEATSKYDIVVNQLKYSPLDKHIEKNLLPFMINEHITVQAYTPIEKGLVARNPTLIKIGNKYGKTPVQVALNYLISHKMVTAIPKSERKERVEEFHGAMGWRLSTEDILKIKKL